MIEIVALIEQIYEKLCNFHTIVFKLHFFVLFLKNVVKVKKISNFCRFFEQCSFQKKKFFYFWLLKAKDMLNSNSFKYLTYLELQKKLTDITVQEKW